jgi:hypothetical protein
MEKTSGDRGYFIDRGQERNLIRFGWLIKASNLPYELQ